MSNNQTSSLWLGILAGVGAAVFYTLANAFLRKLATETDFLMVVFVKALVTATIFVPWLALIAMRIRAATPDSRKFAGTVPSGRYFWIMLLASIQTQIFGNGGHQIALGVIGMALAVPIYMGSLVAASALFGRWFLKEGISGAVAFALGLLVLSVVLLSFGGQAAGDAVKQEQTSFLKEIPFYIGVIASMGVGIAFAVLAVAIRYVLQSGVPNQTPLVFVSVVGTVMFGSALLLRDGFDFVNQYEWPAWQAMLAAGVCNAIAFLSLSWSLKLLPVVYVNAINVSQVAMAAAIGILFFDEPLSRWLAIGLIVMVIGFVLLGRFSAAGNSRAG